MPLQSSGAISLTDIQTEFGGANPISINEYYQNGGIVGAVFGIPTSGQIAFSDFYGKSNFIMPDQGIFAFGNNNSGPPGGNSSTGVLSYNTISKSNIITNQGVVASDTSNTTATARQNAGGSGYGGDKAIVTFGGPDASNIETTNRYNLINNLGIISADTTTSAATRKMAATQAEYGGDRAISIGGFGNTGGGGGGNPIYYNNKYNLITNTGVVQSDSTTPTGYISSTNARVGVRYGGDKAFFYKDINSRPANLTQASSYTYNINLVSNTGQIANDVTGVTSFRNSAASSGYGGDKATIVYGGRWYDTSYWTTSTLISNTGTFVGVSNSLGTGRSGSSGTTYGRDKAIIGYGAVITAQTGASVSLGYKFTYINNLGVLTSEVNAVGSERQYGIGAGIG